MRPPKVVEVSAQVAIMMAALGAAAEAHSASRMASASLDDTTPGLVQFPGWTVASEPEEKDERPKVERKVFQSEVLKRFVFSISAMVWPWPEMPALKRGFKL